jgi:two-component system NtrC family sensor kinase
MFFFPYLAAFLLARNIRTSLRPTELYSKWNNQLRLMLIGIGVAFLVLDNFLPKGVPDIVAGFVLITLVTFVDREEDFKPFRAYAQTHIPLAVISMIYGVAVMIVPETLRSYVMYIQFATLGAFAWIFGRAGTFRKQQKQVEKVTEKNSELEMLVAERTAELTRQKDELQLTVQELKATQAQLIQQEKLASLGELTAGIAHEIQNPLNFVNNFSEVSMELVDEMEAELNKGDLEEAISIAADVKQNLEKIRHHGKRADGIVKGMLQHSRASTGQKEPTDINALADEYLRLAYHGLRAKDKSFNAELITHFAPDMPKIAIVGQDVGRVLLNLFNNAFYSVKQKQQTGLEGFKPTIEVSTAVKNGKAEIIVRDNGTGIPEEVQDKILQPFFTTKPTGEGTGLGLSLSYDIIVKSHKGDIHINSEEGKGAEFVITLPL